MSMVFIVCAVFGGTFLVLQAIMTLIGLGGDALHTDAGGDVGHELGGDAHVDGSHDTADQHHHSTDHGSSHLFAMLSFRGLVAAMAFFGIGGLTAEAAQLTVPAVLLIAVACGLAAMYAVYWVMQALASLQAEGTVRIGRSIGQPATVYLRIPGNRSGTGKIQINLQNRIMEYEAVTEGDALPAGARVVVVGVVNSETVAVRPRASGEGVCNE